MPGGGGGDKVDNGFGTLFFDNRICCFKIVPQKYLFSIIWDNMFFLKQLFYSFSRTI